MTHFLTIAAARAALLATTALLLTCASPAQATAAREPAGDWLLVTVMRDGAPADTKRTALLSCAPPRGHARAAQACAELDAADGRITHIPLRNTFCTMIHAPVTAHAHGQWRGQPVDYTQTFPNPCVMTARTGAVFALDPQE